MASNLRPEGGMRERSVKIATMQLNRMRKAQVRIAQPNPVSRIICETMIGKMTPPRELPAAMIPIAIPRFLKNQVETQPMAGLKRKQAPMAEQTP